MSTSLVVSMGVGMAIFSDLNVKSEQGRCRCLPERHASGPENFEM